MAAVKHPGILILSPFFSPNIGGVETHLDDLVGELVSQHYPVFVHTYSPLTTRSSYKSFEKSPHLEVYHYRWFGYNLFPKLESLPFFDFLYLTPYLFIRTFVWLLFNRHKIGIIHSHGLNAALAGNIFQALFGIPNIVSIHAVYDTPSLLTSRFITFILNNSTQVLALSHASQTQLASLGVHPSKVSLFSLWIDTNRFTPASLPTQFTVLYVGRLIAKKGIMTLLQVASTLPQIHFIIVGDGPLSSQINDFSQKYPNVTFVGPVTSSQVSQYYHQASILCVPSQYEEGFGRVAMEAVASGLPVIASNRGGLPEALDNSVALLVDPTTAQIKDAILHLYNHPQAYSQLRSHTRPYALQHFSSKCSKVITDAYDRHQA